MFSVIGIFILSLLFVLLCELLSHARLLLEHWKGRWAAAAGDGHVCAVSTMVPPTYVEVPSSLLCVRGT